MPDGIVGREHELGSAGQFLRGLDAGIAALVFEGEPGIGKSTVWDQAVARAREESIRVLSCRPVEAEVPLAFAALADLLEPVFDGVVSGLPGPQARALAVALLREDPGPRRLDPRAVAAATLGTLRMLGTTETVVVAIDDIQWLDRSSARILEFAIRRATQLPIGLIACQRIEGTTAIDLDLDRTIPAGRLTRVRIGGLGVPALRRILEERLGRAFPHRTLVEIERTAGGNPLFALEIARGIPDAPRGSAPLPLPGSLRQLVEQRVDGLPLASRKVLLIAAATPNPSVDLIAATSGVPRSLPALDRAAAAGIISIDDGYVRFMHPLFASAIYSSAPGSERRLVHRRLADASGDVEARARHLALSADAPDRKLASELDAAAEQARRRGAPDAAAELAEYARTLTPRGQAADVHRRTATAAEFHFHAGELTRAQEMLNAVVREEPAGRQRADALKLLGEISTVQSNMLEAARLFDEALLHVADDPAAISAIEVHLAFATNALGDFVAAKTHADRAMETAAGAREPALLAEALAVKTMTHFMVGAGVDHASLARALRLEDPQREGMVELRPTLIAGYLALYLGEIEDSTRHLRRLRERIIERGEETDLVLVSMYLAWGECWRGNLALAEEYAREAVDTAVRLDSPGLECLAQAFGALAPAYAGDVALARDRALRSHALVEKTVFKIATLWADWALALVALSQADPRAADEALGPIAAIVEANGLPEPIRVPSLADEIEALIGLAQLDRADRLLGILDAAATKHQRPWAMAAASRCRALLLAAQGDLDGASGAAAEASARSEGLELKLDLGRTLLILGQIERRRRRKRAALDALRKSLGIFEAAGARLWAERARKEIERIGLRRAGLDQLSATEQRVAELAAAGRTNREVAAALFLSPKTVEANLARVYSKLGIHSRAELGARLGDPDRSGTAQAP